MTGLFDHLATGSTTVCRAWRVTRRDGTVLGFTDHDADLMFDAVTFRAGAGLTARTLSQTTGLSVDNTEALGAISAPWVSEADLRSGRWDGAAVVCWLVNWADTAQRIVQFRGTVGEITQVGQAFRAELRGLTEALNRPMGRVFQRDCSAALGDARCKIDLADSAYRSETRIQEVADAGRVLILPAGGYGAGWFEHGTLAFLDGVAAGLSAAIKRDRRFGSRRHVELWLPPELLPLAGDAVSMTAGCDGTSKACLEKFINFNNFRGFPDIPGEDWMAASPLRAGRKDGGSRRGNDG